MGDNVGWTLDKIWRSGSRVSKVAGLDLGFSIITHQTPPVISKYLLMALHFLAKPKIIVAQNTNCTSIFGDDYQKCLHDVKKIGKKWCHISLAIFTL